MRIAMIGPFGLAPKGTMRVRALPLARALAVRGHVVTVVMPPWHTPDEPPRAWDEAGVRWNTWRSRRASRPPSPGGERPAVALRAGLAARCDPLFQTQGLCGAGRLAGPVAATVGALSRALVVDEDDWEGPGGWNALEPYPWALRQAFAWQERWGLRHADAVTVASRTLQSLVWGLGVPPERVHYLPNGCSPRRAGDGAVVRARHGLGRAPVVLLYTRLFEFDAARPVEVFQRIVEQAPDARLLVVGAALYPEQDARFDRAVVDAGLTERVVRAGWLPAEALPDYFAAADVALYPFDDTLVNRCKCAVKLVDLLAAGVPVVADAVGQNAEYIRAGETGLLTPSGDVQAMSAAALRLLSDAALRQRLGAAAARELATRYDWSVLAEQALRAYQA